MASRLLNPEEVQALIDRHYWEGWAWFGLGPVGIIVEDSVFGPVLASKGADGVERYAVNISPALVESMKQPEYHSDPQYGQAIEAAVQWEIEQAKKFGGFVLDTTVAAGKAITKGARDIAEPIVAPLAIPLVLIGAIALVVLVNQKGGR